MTFRKSLLVRRPFLRRRGVTLVEYGLLILLIGALAIGAVRLVGGVTGDLFASVNSSLSGDSAEGDPEDAPGPPVSTACASGFAPGSLVSISYGPANGDPNLPSGTLDPQTADANGEIATCDPIVIPIEVPAGSYEFSFSGADSNNVGVSDTAPAVISSPDVAIESTAPPAPTNPTGGIATMTVRVRDCSAVYLREEATMNSPSTLHYPGTQWTVYATQGWWNSSSALAPAIVGGTWPQYTCDGGSSNTWYELVDGTGYVFTGGVDIIGSPTPAWPMQINRNSLYNYQISTACQDAIFTFNGVSGQRVAWQWTNQTFVGDATLKLPSGGNLVGSHTASNNGFHDVVTLTETGVYTLTNGPRSCATGSGSVYVWNVPPDTTAAATVGGSAVTINMTSVGQNGYVTFTGTAGQKIAFNRAGSLTGNANLTVVRPAGTNLVGGETYAAGFRDTITLDASGTHRITVSPSGMITGSATISVWEVPADAIVPLAINGGPGTLTLSVPGQNGELTFAGTAGQTVSWTYAGSLSGSNISSASLIAPNGSTVMGGHTPAPAKTYTLTQTGTYRLRINPAGAATGTMTTSFTAP